MTENHLPKMLPFDQIEQFKSAGTDGCGIRVFRVVLRVTGKACAEGNGVKR